MTQYPVALSPEARSERAAFLGRVAHELRGPASTALGALSEVGVACSNPNHLGDFQDFLEMATRGIVRVLRIADRLDQTSRLERSTVTFRSDICDLPLVIRRAITAAQSIARRPAISVVFTPPTEAVTYNGDAAWLSIVVLELVSNAVRHASTNVLVELEQPEGYSVIRVTNDGTPAEPFGPERFQAPRDMCGLGLSLSIVADVANAHSGALEIEPGTHKDDLFGARVTLTLPRLEDGVMAPRKQKPHEDARDEPPRQEGALTGC